MTIEYKNNDSFIDGISLKKIAGDFGTPCFIYSHNDLVKNFSEIKNVFASEKRKVFYSVKANSNLSILKVLLELGAGFDIVSLGELERVIKIGAQPEKIIYSGVGKSEEEIIRSLEYGIHCFNVESFSELERINSIAAKLNKVAPVSIRINPNIDPGSHEFISTGVETTKFGINLKNMMDAFIYANNEKSIDLLGIDYHIGSQIESLDPFKEAIISVKKIIDQLKENNINIKLIDMGGGLGINYQNNDAPSLNDFGKTINQVINDNELSDYDFIIELGRSIVGNVGYILTSVEYIKKDSEKNFVIVDAGMDNLIRPALYNAWHEIKPITDNKEQNILCDIVGPVCECTDFLGKDRRLSVQQGDLLIISSCGAYASSMASNYNSRPKPSEIMIKNGEMHIISRKEKINDLFSREIIVS
jgi:diaminopimelate decarboxylase